MRSRLTLAKYIERYSQTSPTALSVAGVIDAIAAAAAVIAELMRDGPLCGITGEVQGTANADGDTQKDLDVRADDIIRCALSAVPVAVFASEEAAEPEMRDPIARVCVAVDPLDGSSNIEVNMTVGTIFSVVPATPDLSRAFMQSGDAQLAAGFVVYGPQTALVLTLGNGVDIFILDRADGAFKLVREHVRIPEDAPEFAINASNRRHWEPPITAFIDECLAGANGLSSMDFNMRWIGSLVAEAYRILTRGGVFLYPADSRAGYGEGRLRLVYEAHPMAFIVEQAGGAASTGRARILDLVPESLHQRVPLIMGSLDAVQRVENLHTAPTPSAPLFARRGFFRV